MCQEKLEGDNETLGKNAILEEHILINAFGKKVPEGGGAHIVIARRQNKHFRLPKDPCVPIIMVAAGTGIAPFRGFLRFRDYQRSKGIELGPAWLFYGCRHPGKDFLYPELYSFAKDGLIRLNTAFSEDIKGKIYVQHKIVENGLDIIDLMMKKKAVFYVCGDALAMVKDVRDTMIALIKSSLSLGTNPSDLNIIDERASLIQKEWVAESRYLLDIWA